jgi:alkyl hydroperoxide reductase subunit AhpC
MLSRFVRSAARAAGPTRLALRAMPASATGGMATSVVRRYSAARSAPAPSDQSASIAADIADMRETLSEAYQTYLEDSYDDSEADEADPAPLVQGFAPMFSGKAVIDGKIQEFDFSEFASDKMVVLFFYPLDFTFVCPTEITAFSDRVEEFRKLGAEVVAVSVDSVHSHLAWTKQARSAGGLGAMNIPLVSDITKEISRSYQVLLEDEGISLRGLFIIDAQGKIRQQTVNDLPIGRSVDETLRLVQAIQFADTHGEVCPANWAPGKPTIDTANANKFFSAQKDN